MTFLVVTLKTQLFTVMHKKIQHFQGGGGGASALKTLIFFEGGACVRRRGTSAMAQWHNDQSKPETKKLDHLKINSTIDIEKRSVCQDVHRIFYCLTVV